MSTARRIDSSSNDKRQPTSATQIETVAEDAVSRVSFHDQVTPRPYFKWQVILIVIMVSLIVLALIIDYDAVAAFVQDVINWIEEHPYEAAVYIWIIFTTVEVLCIPIGPKFLYVAYLYCSITKSFWYGFFISLGLTFTACMAAFNIAFALGRYKLQDYVIRKIEENKEKKPWLDNFYLIDDIFRESNVGGESIKIVALIRIMIHPCTITSYCLGTTSIKFWQFSVGSLAWLYKNTFKIYISCMFYEIDFVVDPKEKDNASFKNNVIIVVHIIIACIINILLALYCKTVLDQKLLERKLKNERQALQNDEHTTETGRAALQTEQALNFELRSNASRGSNYNPNALNESRRRNSSTNVRQSKGYQELV